MIWLTLFLSLFCAEVTGGVTCEVKPVSEITPTLDLNWIRPLQMKTQLRLPAETSSEVSFQMLLPAQTAYVLRCDPKEITVSDTLVPDYGLTSDAEAAVAAAPRWLRPDLTDNLMRLNQAQQDVVAEMILNPRDPRLRDEIAFQAAHIGSNHMTSMNPSIISVNVDSLFAIDADLDYVEIVDYGNPTTDDDYYSTTRYTVIDENGSTIYFELPREIYYWYIIHPRITDELPKIVYEKFWREFLYYDNGTVSYTYNPDTSAEPYPLLRDRMQDVTYAWRLDGEEDQGAIRAVHGWVGGVMHWGATAPRPIQPNEIATDHDGNCGEYQDIKCAGARTALIPTVGVLDINEDHVWCANWYPDDYNNPEGGGHWDPAQESAYDKDRGGSKYCSLIWNWRGDGYQYSDIETYSNSCTLSVQIYDTKGRPVGNGEVKLLSEGWQSPFRVKGYSGITNRDGVFMTTFGEEQNYAGYAIWENLGTMIDSADALAGTHHVVSCTLSSDYNPQARELNPQPGTPQPRQGVSVRLDVDAEYDLGHCPTYSYEETSSKSTIQFAPGKLTDFFITDLGGLADFISERQFTTYGHFSIEGELDTILDVPTEDICYIVFYNNHADLEEVISGTVTVTGEPVMLAVEIPVLQNPLLSEYVDIWVVPTTEELENPPEVTVTLGGEQESLDMQSVAGTFNYVGNYKFTEDGTASIDVSADDTTFARTFNVAAVTASGGLLASVDGLVKLELGEDVVDAQTYFTIITEKVSDTRNSNPYVIEPVDRGDAISPAYRVGPSGNVLSGSATLRFSYGEADNPSNLVVMRYLDGAWSKVTTHIDRNNSEALTTVDKLGIFQLVNDPDHFSPDLPSLADIKILANYPRKDEPLLSLTLASDTDLSVEVFDASGRKVSSLAQGSFSAGEHAIKWTATDASGKSLAKGIYFCRLITPEVDKTVKLVHVH